MHMYVFISAAHNCFTNGPSYSLSLCSTGGFEDWVVSCTCGTTVDDGERMVECEMCGVWLHTRCQGNPDAECIPDDFTCSNCMCMP